VKKVLGILGLLVAIVLVTALLAPGFLSAYNVQNLVRWTALFGILSIGVVFPIVSGGIDLSIGSVVGLVGCVMPWLLVERGMGIPATLAVVLALSLAIGCVHGLLVTRMRIQPFVVTLCGLLFYRGIALDRGRPDSRLW
jgi:ribose transport system permease protein